MSFKKGLRIILERISGSEKGKKSFKELGVDTGSIMSYSLGIGTGLDALAGLNLAGIAASRGFASLVNLATGGAYGKYTNWVFKKTTKFRHSPVLREVLRDTLKDGADFLSYLVCSPGREYHQQIVDHLVDTRKAQDKLVDLFVFNTFQVPIYGAAVAVGSLIQHGYVDLEKALTGAKNLATISPFIGPTMNGYMSKARELFRLKSAAEKAQEEYQVKQGGREDE